MAQKTLNPREESRLGQIGQFAENIGEQLGEAASNASEQISNKVDVIRDHASHLSEVTSDAVRSYGEEAIQYVKKHPVQSALIGVGIGALVGAFLGRRR